MGSGSTESKAPIIVGQFVTTDTCQRPPQGPSHVLRIVY